MVGNRNNSVGLISTEYFDVTGGNPLCCPLCLEEWPDGRGVWLHQYGVEAFFREEDREEGVHGYVSDTKSFLDVGGDCGGTSRNPSSRRSGLIVYFFCEWCSNLHPEGTENDPIVILELCISQHKGVTLMEWLAKKYDRRLNPDPVSLLSHK